MDELRHLKRKLDQIDIEINEEATKFYFVVPFFMTLGYDMFNPGEVCPEYKPRFYGLNERVDFAFFIDDVPRLFVEVKRLKEVLSNKHVNWLAKYYNSEPSVNLSILTNGRIYCFFTDSVYENIMDKKPFFIFDIAYPTDFDLYLLSYFKRDLININSVKNCINSINAKNKLMETFNTYCTDSELMKKALMGTDEDFFNFMYSLGEIDKDYLPYDVANYIIPINKVRQIFVI